MRKYDWAWLHRGGREIRPADAKPKPFNGVHPLRWAVSINYKLPGDKQDRSFRYIGKPSKPVAKRAWRILDRAREGAAYLVEFDRGGAVATWIGQLPMSEMSVSQSQHDLLTRFYRYSRRGWAVMTWFHQMQPFVVSYGDKQFVTYAEATQVPGRWEEYGRWLQSANLLT